MKTAAGDIFTALRVHFNLKIIIEMLLKLAEPHNLRTAKTGTAACNCGLVLVSLCLLLEN